MIIGCGGGGSSDDSSKSNEETTTSSSSSNTEVNLTWSPKTTNVTCDLSPVDGGDYSASGDVTVTCQKDDKQSVRYKLANVKSLTAMQIVKHKYLTIENSSDKLHTVYDYKQGTVLYSGTINGTAYDCVETYPSIVPETLTNSTIEKILSWQGDSNDRVSSTCPNSFYDAKIDTSYNNAYQIKGLSFFGINYTIYDDNNNQHFITLQVK